MYDMSSVRLTIYFYIKSTTHYRNRSFESTIMRKGAKHPQIKTVIGGFLKAGDKALHLYTINIIISIDFSSKEHYTANAKCAHY